MYLDNFIENNNVKVKPTRIASIHYPFYFVLLKCNDLNRLVRTSPNLKHYSTPFTIIDFKFERTLKISFY